MHRGKPPVSKQDEKEEEEEYTLNKRFSWTLVTNCDKPEKQSFLFEGNARHQWFNSLIYKGPRKEEGIVLYYLSSLFHRTDYCLKLEVVLHGVPWKGESDSSGLQNISALSSHNNCTR
jgi:hypothetical protein